MHAHYESPSSLESKKKDSARKRKGCNIHLTVQRFGAGTFSRSHKKVMTDLGMQFILTKALVQ